MPEKVIQDNILIAHETFHYLICKKRGRKYELVVKVDMSKAYDRLEWDFIEVVLLKFGFCNV